MPTNAWIVFSLFIFFGQTRHVILPLLLCPPFSLRLFLIFISFTLTSIHSSSSFQTMALDVTQNKNTYEN
ncbi:hypothetical protein V8F20_007195 [Naviculisporaceae sp. PSN 640]